MEATGHMDLDICQCWWLTEKVRADDVYAQNLYAAMCNQEWQYQDVWTVLTDRTWSCSWRTSGAIVADIRSKSDYMDWYCSGSLGNPDNHGHTPNRFVGEGYITDEIRHDLAEIGWVPMVDQ